MNKLAQYQLFKVEEINIINLSNQLINYFGGKMKEYKKILMKFYISKNKTKNFLFYNCFILTKLFDDKNFYLKTWGPLNNNYENNNHKSVTFLNIIKFFDDPNLLFIKNDMLVNFIFFGDAYLINLNKNFKIYILNGEFVEKNNNKKENKTEEKENEKKFIYIIIEEIEYEKDFDQLIENNETLKYKIFQFFKNNNFKTFNIDDLIFN